MGKLRKLLGLECRFLGTEYCEIGDKENPICFKYGGNYYQGFISQKAGCYREATIKEDEKIFQSVNLSN